MMKYCREFYIALFVLLAISYLSLLGCKKDTGGTADQVKLVVKKEINIESEATKYLNKIYPVVSSSPNKNYIGISNIDPVTVVQIDHNGNFIDRFGTPGRGPKEILSARFFGFNQQNDMVIYDKSNAAIKKFSSSDNTVSSYNSPVSSGIDITTNHLNQCNGKWYLGIDKLDAQPKPTTPTIGVFDSQFKKVNSFGNFDPYLYGHQSFLQAPTTSIDCKTATVFTTHPKVPYIQIYNMNSGSRIARIQIRPPSFNLSDKFISKVRNTRRINDFLIEDQSTSIFISHNKDYIYLPFRNETSTFYETKDYTDRNHFIAVFSRKDYSFLGEVSPEGAPVGATKEGNIITLMNDDPSNFNLRILEIKVSE